MHVDRRTRGPVTVLVTGASGYLGGNCAREFRAKGNFVYTTDRRGEVDFLGDLSDPQFVSSLPEVDTLVHCAGVQYLSDDIPLLARKRYFYRNNVLAAKNLALRYCGSKTHVLFTSSSMIYAQSRTSIYSVHSMRKGQGLYSSSKLAAQQYITQMPNPTAIVIPCIIAGKGRGGLFRPFVRTMKRWGVVFYAGTGRHKIHMVHVEDVTSLIVKIVQERASGTYNAASLLPLSIKEWVNEIEGELNLKAVRHITLPLPLIHFVSACLAYIPLAREQLLMLKFEHVLSLEESLSLDWRPRWTNAEIVRQLARTLAEKA